MRDVSRTLATPKMGCFMTVTGFKAITNATKNSILDNVEVLDGCFSK